jgi:hypothetical protein
LHGDLAIDLHLHYPTAPLLVAGDVGANSTPGVSSAWSMPPTKACDG